MELPKIKSRTPSKSHFYNHQANKVSYSVDDKKRISNTYSVQRVTSHSQSMIISKSLKKIKLRQRQKDSLSRRMEQRMKIRRAINLEKVYEDNTRMFARIYTQKSQYSNNKMSYIFKRPHRYAKQNTESMSDLKDSKMQKMRQMFNSKPKHILPYIRQQLKSLKDLNIAVTEPVNMEFYK